MNAKHAAIAVVVAIAVAGCGGGDHDRPRAKAKPKPEPTVEQATPAQIRRQDPPDPERQRRESQIMDSRPLLGKLPIALGDVTISIAGLSDDGKRTRLSIDPGDRTDEQALAVYRDLLSAYGDDGTAYVVEVNR